MARRRYKRKARSHGEVELNMTAMLDMAFQLLAFFVFTFKPGAVESQVSLRMPPSVGSGGGGTILEQPEELDKSKTPLPISVIANGEGDIERITVNNSTIPGGAVESVMATLSSTLAAELGKTPYDSVALQASQNLTSERLLQVMDVCTKQTIRDEATGEVIPLTKISVAELPGGQ